jgi:uncharacterized protein YdeI (YjbR/CyaY-like superfamily)
MDVLRSPDTLRPLEVIHVSSIYRIFKTAADWRAWLEKHHGRASEIWLAYYKKSSGKRSVTYAEALDEALCFGWIDSTVRRLDEEKFMQRYTPRRPGSIWSTLNKKHIARLAAAGRMAPAGLAKVAAAKKDGSWNKLNAIDSIKPETPADLEAALRKRPGARAKWEAQPPSQKKMYSWWVIQAKRPETRARRVEETVRRVLAGRKAGF